MANQNEFTNNEIMRYSRHLLLDKVGVSGQSKLNKARVLIIGIGGLGNPAAQYLAAAGVGHIGLLDPDVVSLSNLQRQILFSESDIGKPKVEIAKRQLLRINPNVHISANFDAFSTDKSEELIKTFDIVLDCTDNFPCRYGINEVCTKLKKINVHGAIYKFDGQISVFDGANGPCYRCLYPTPPSAAAIPNCAATGVLGVLPGLIGVMQATEAIKLILGIGKTLRGRLLHFDALNMDKKEFALEKDPNCPCCVFNQQLSFDDVESCENRPAESNGISPIEVKQDPNAILLDIRSAGERAISKIGGSIHCTPEQLREKISTIPHNKTIVLYCKSGIRSAKSVEMLSDMDRTISSLNGGIINWINCVDKELPLY